MENPCPLVGPSLRGLHTRQPSTGFPQASYLRVTAAVQSRDEIRNERGLRHPTPTPIPIPIPSSDFRFRRRPSAASFFQCQGMSARAMSARAPGSHLSLWSIAWRRSTSPRAMATSVAPSCARAHATSRVPSSSSALPAATLKWYFRSAPRRRLPSLMLSGTDSAARHACFVKLGLCAAGLPKDPEAPRSVRAIPHRPRKPFKCVPGRSHSRPPTKWGASATPGEAGKEPIVPQPCPERGCASKVSDGAVCRRSPCGAAPRGPVGIGIGIGNRNRDRNRIGVAIALAWQATTLADRPRGGPRVIGTRPQRGWKRN